MVESSKKVRPWRQDVKFSALEAIEADGEFKRFVGPVRVTMDFVQVRPKSHYRTGRNAHLLKDTAPTWKMTSPDLSKLIRSTEDAITEASVWDDDRQVAALVATDQWGDWSGVTITIESLED